MDMKQIMQQAQQFQQKMAEIQGELAGKEVSSSVGGGMVKATVNGKSELVRLSIEKAVIDPADPGMLQDLVIAAVNEALRQSQDLARREMAKLTGGLNIPGLF
ncbi:MAG: YbaB/EbfC family nucleoid-associated protein [Proteobacteria bacterium]|nr:YbaB/EbfC family nucleoid-associated protein [Pseudomonadota bacterium]MBU1738141.1 YbaB/EbfC family nucleoid-associated protein [Pseudomonadota bacterium]